ncbi:hypothetical protein CALVIDRAFT_566896 [Calocera viscosa TUFC12733]|uniref:Uncharacterized protein n=1 Tax=Calocera viscosa (strain TUFC12733) TaxID=1330018 RepID=A0A167IUH4_CALVF|nr:hypothetical protein CALVIDRAFT_566896 [Calocera viscosa TUFC12733]
MSVFDETSKGEPSGKRPGEGRNLIEGIQHFAPSWFAVTMGTPVLRVILR